MIDSHRPQYHFLPPANWMNDPNGLIQWQGVYHLFYQYNPHSALWGDIHWGHASSRDLVHWRHLPIALAPDPGGPDHAGVWSGCAVDWDGLPTMVYTAWDGKAEHVCLATSHDDLQTWEKYPGNPVIANPPSGLETLGFRDPCIWRENGTWRMVLGSGIRGVGGAILLYSSPDLVNWSSLGPMITGDVRQSEPVWAGKMWECPNFFPLGDAQHMLIISAMDLEPSESLCTIYMLGTFRENTFQTNTLAMLDGGEVYFYAPQAFRDQQGRRIIFGWSREARAVEGSLAAGWAGVMTLPRLLEPRTGGGLVQRPAPEVDLLRGVERSWKDVPIPAENAPGGLTLLEGLAGDTIELEIHYDLSQVGDEPGTAFGLLARRAPSGEEMTEIRVDWQARLLIVDTLRSSTNADVHAGHYEAPLEHDGSTTLHLRVFLDRSIIEVFANDQAVITARVYPMRQDSTGIALFARHSPVKVKSLRMWEMRAE